MEKKKKKGKIIDIGSGLEGFADWVDLNVNDPSKEREDDMYSLAAGFSARICKQEASGKGLKRSSLDKEG